MRKTGTGYRIAGSLENTDLVLNNTFWFGVYPGMTNEMVDRIVEVIHEYYSRG
jgi:CDP-6-deoxy-D-xylo-4-hexulose-3-dehydrase